MSLLVVLTACGNASGASVQTAGGTPKGSAAAASPAVAVPGTILERSCGADAGAGGGCAAGFTLDDVQYILDCTAVRDDAVETTRLGGGRVQGQQVEARTIRATDRSVAVAVSGASRDCGYAVSVESTGWVFAYPFGADEAAQQLSVCLAGALSDQQRASYNCSSIG